MRDKRNTQGFVRAAALLGALGLFTFRAAGQSFSESIRSALAPSKAKLAANQTVNVLVIGDSLSVRDGSYLPYFTALLQDEYGDAGAGYHGFSKWSGAGFNSGWLQGQINQDTEPYRALDGLWASFELPPTQFFSATFADADEFAELHYLAQPGGGTAMLNVPGGQAVSLDTDAAEPEVRVLSYAFPGANRTVQIVPAKDGPVTILGQVDRSGAPGIVLHRAANGGWGVDTFLRRDFTFDQQVHLLAPDLIFVWLGQNDQGYNRVLYRARVALLVDRLFAQAPDAKMILIGTYDSGAEAIQQLVDGTHDAARARHLGFVDMFRVAGSHAFLQSHGYLDDGIHMSPAGGQYIAGILFEAWKTDGLSLYAHPSSLSEPYDPDISGGGGYRLCLADVNLDNLVDLNDFFLFLTDFDNGLPAADLNGDGVDLEDFFDFLTHFDQGC